VNKIKAIIFDYDGVIAESVNVKTETFAKMYKPYGNEIVVKVMKHHEANGGMSRFEKFKIYHKDFLEQEINSLKVAELAKQFSDIVLQKVADSPYVEGAYNFISSNYQKYNFYISTGTPTDEIEIILEKNDIRKYFKNVYGSPERKNIHVKKILKKYNLSKKEVVFVGDALTDRDAARDNGIEFIARYTTAEEIKKEKYLINNFSQLENILNLL
jgi:HAD superfamily hydrolase (TIGR01549 family)